MTSVNLLESEAFDANVHRRDFLQKAGALGLLSAGTLHPSFTHLLAGSAGAAEAKTGSGLITREKDPLNLEFPFDTLSRPVITNDLFFVRNHFPIPKLAARTWRLKVEGAVKTPLELSLDDLRQMKARTVTALLECAGNGRAFLKPKAKGVQWALGAVGNARWTGVPLGAILKRAGLRDKAVDVVLEGADSGTVSPDPWPGKIHFARSIPRSKALKSKTILAYQMNGASLPVNHGFPLRAVVPGWYGVASVKWLTRILVTTRPFRGWFQTFDYTYFKRIKGLPTVVPITQLEVKAQVARPAAGEKIPAGKNYRIFGAAWTGTGQIEKVEVSVDSGRTWAPARLRGQPATYTWTFWEYTWRTPKKAGRYQVMARATDSLGRTQPLKRDPDRKNYLISHVLPTECSVGS
jgi:DMSO/TMAO reductase YedYZ molybdopterin-dependent catalytic subunit